jgi:hypothetical protein
MTIDDVRAALGTGRAAWVETTGSSETLAILVRAGRFGGATLIRYTALRGSYHWVTAKHLRRRADLDVWPEPAWLQRARASRRPPAILWDVLNVRTVTAEPSDDAQIGPMDFETDADGRVL